MLAKLKSITYELESKELDRAARNLQVLRPLLLPPAPFFPC